MTSGRRSIATTPKTHTISVASTQVVAPVMTRWLLSSVVTRSEMKIVTSEMPPVSMRA